VAVRQAYDLDHHIYTEGHLGKHPFALIEMHKSEAAANKGLYESYRDKYDVHRVKEFWGLSFLEFISLPGDMAQMLIRGSINKASRESVDEEASRKLAAELRAMEEKK
jgi:hypothetical protein